MNSCLRIIGTMLISSLLLTACSEDKPIQLNRSAPAEVQEEEGQTLTIVNPESIEPTIKSDQAAKDGKKYQIQTRLTDFRLISPTTGLAWGSTRNELRLYRTEDNGKTWTNISPSSSVLFPYNPEFGRDLFFLNSNQGWIIRNSTTSSEAIVLRTGDGGITWKMASLPDSARVVSIFFLDAEQGWIVTEGDFRSSSEAKAIYSTTDGGATWNKIMSTPIIASEASSQANKLPKVGIVSGMTFTDKNRGFITVLESGQPSLYVTTSSGTAWSKAEGWFNSSKFTTCTRFSVESPEFFRSNNLHGWVPFGCVIDDSIKYQGYFTSDGGASWSFMPFSVPWQKGESSALATTFLNRMEGWFIHGSSVYHTEDQGENWTQLPKSAKLTEIVAEYRQVLKVQFYNSQIGWLLVAQDDNNRSLLMQTIDGGVTWKVL